MAEPDRGYGVDMRQPVVERVGEASLTGWWRRVADAVARPISRRTPLEEQRVRALVGIVFLVLSIVYVVQVLRDVRRAARDAA